MTILIVFKIIASGFQQDNLAYKFLSACRKDLQYLTNVCKLIMNNEMTRNVLNIL